MARPWLWVLMLPLLLMLGCSQLRGPAGDLNQVARDADHELAALEIAYAEALAAAPDEAAAAEVERVFGVAFEAHRAVRASWRAAERLIRVAIELERSGGPPDLAAIAEAIAELRRAYEEWLRLRALALDSTEVR